ncbi:2-isopropylmalate synthase [Scopulibacillus darangshiensis]|uniref:2-isopropylmalate synthase n=1 Tax=Scopulibacillus darangshiensis TaxID=442528 RepID=A0A4R2P2F9_9BACL|nr:2-isopropylmalate synthase [Scopulibacillus darangshiensis]TCP28870.1 2-isopropylmalate synthase [Scopulibacillus darangshiensis]
MRKIHVFDTTLRDGEQSPGVHLTMEEKVMIARQLEKLGVDRIEAGFPASSLGEVANVQAISKAVRNTSIAVLARAHKKDIEAARDALKGAATPCLHIVLATSPIHRKYKLNMTKEQVIERAEMAIQYGKNYFSDIEFSLEDASRTELDFMYKVVDRAIQAGAKVINLPDTVGYASPETFGDMFRKLRENVPRADQVLLSTHCHNDLGMATANTMAAIYAGVDQVEGTINGIGERAGNTAIEEVALALETRKDVYNAQTDMVFNEIYNTSRMVSHYTGMTVQPNKAIVGENAFAHESGIHQDGMLKESSTYEIIRPSTVGVSSSTIVLGKHSGRHALKKKIEYLGYHLTEAELAQAFEDFKKMIDQKKYVIDDDIHKLINQKFINHATCYELSDLVISYPDGRSQVTIELTDEKQKQLRTVIQGNGVIDALYNGIEQLIGMPFQLQDYTIRSKSIGKDAVGEVIVKVKKDDQSYSGRGMDTDIIKASAKAYLIAINQFFQKDHQVNKDNSLIFTN